MRLDTNTLRTVRKLSGCTQQRLADLIGVTKSYVNKIERGERPLTPHIERRIREALRLSDERIAQVKELCQRLEDDKKAI